MEQKLYFCSSKYMQGEGLGEKQIIAIEKYRKIKIKTGKNGKKLVKNYIKITLKMGICEVKP